MQFHLRRRTICSAQATRSRASCGFHHQHPNETWIKVYQIASDHPLKLAAKDEFCGDDPPVTFHLVVMDDKAKKRALDKLLGKRISVVLDSFFCSETAWHVGDAVSFEWHLAKRSAP